MGVGGGSTESSLANVGGTVAGTTGHVATVSFSQDVTLVLTKAAEAGATNLVT